MPEKIASAFFRSLSVIPSICRDMYRESRRLPGRYMIKEFRGSAGPGIVALLILFLFPAYPLSDEFIMSGLSDEYDYQAADSILKRLPLLEDFRYVGKKGFMENKALVDSSRRILCRYLACIDGITDTLPSLKSMLLQAVACNRRYLLGDDDAVFRAESLFAGIRRRYPERIEGLWFQALHRIETGRCREGIVMLDSVAGRIEPDHPRFWRDYAYYLWSSLSAPVGTALWPLRTVFASGNDDQADGETDGPEAAGAYTWYLFPAEAGHDMPACAFRMECSYRKRWDQDIPAPGSYALVKTGTAFMPHVLSSYQLFRDFFRERRSRSEILIMFDFDEKGHDLERILTDNMPGCYDSVVVDDRYAGAGAFSIRYFDTAADRLRYGGFVGLVGLERHTPVTSTGPADGSAQAGHIRVLLAVVACKEDRVAGERNLRKLADTFVW